MKLRKITTFVLTLLLLFALAACEKKPDVSKDNHLDWTYIQSSGNLGAVTEDGCYYIYMGLLYYTDFVTEKSAVLCARPGCAHKANDIDNPCDAEMPLDGMYMFFENDTLYYMGDENVLYSRDATGGSLKEWGMLAKKYVEEGKGVFVYPLALCNGYLYYEAYIIEPEDIIGGGMSTADATSRCIGRYNIAQKKDEVVILLEDMAYFESVTLYAARENGLIYLYSEGLDPEQNWEKVDAKERLEAQKKMPVHIKHLNTATGETTVLFTTTYVECKNVHTLEDGKIYYGGGNGTIRYDLSTGKVETFYKGEFSSSYYGKGYWLRTKLLDAKTAEYHIYDMNTGKKLPYELEGNFTVTNKSAYGLVMLDFVTGIYSFVSFDSLADGLQEEDLKLLYSNS